MNKPLIIILVIIVVCILFYITQKHSSKEGYNSKYNSPVKNLSGYIQRVINTQKNPEFLKNIIHCSYNEEYPEIQKFYPADVSCKSPENFICSSNDSCAQYGIGEYCSTNNLGSSEQTDGLQVCVCAVKNNGKIGDMAVCNKDEECESGICMEVDGQFSKACTSKKDAFLLGLNLPPRSDNYNIWYDPKSAGVGKFMDKIPQGIATDTGKLCEFTSECSLGEACTQDHYCASQIVRPTEVDAGYFDGGAKCMVSSQCTNNLICTDFSGDEPKGGFTIPMSGMCLCPKDTYYEHTSRTCQKLGPWKQKQCGGGQQPCGENERYDFYSGMCVCNGDSI